MCVSCWALIQNGHLQKANTAQFPHSKWAIELECFHIEKVQIAEWCDNSNWENLNILGQYFFNENVSFEKDKCHRQHVLEEGEENKKKTN